MEEQPLQIPKELLNRNYIKVPEAMQDRLSFEQTKGNEFIDIEPPILRFAGFELNKVNSMRIRVINKAPIPQRINVIPPNSPLFSVKVNKKGAISTGISEEIEVQLRPVEHKYLYETIRIHTETENFVVPVHAYPVLDRNRLRQVFPKVIDFGSLELGTSRVQTYPLASTIPLNFEFEFNILREHADFKITPLKGIIPGLSTAEVSIRYEPCDCTTAVLEAELRISQFDFEPLTVRIMGSGKIPDKRKPAKPAATLPSKIKEDKSKELKFSISRRKNEHLPTLLRPGSARARSQEVIKPTRSIFEKNFLDKFNTVFNLDKQKEIKFLRSIGDAEIPEDEKVQARRQTFYQSFLDTVREDGVSRHRIEFNRDLPIFPHDLGDVMGLTPTWDPLRNNELVLGRTSLARFMRAASRVVIKARMLRRLRLIQDSISKMASTKNTDVSKEKVIAFQMQLESFAWPYKHEESGALPSS
jgi:hypothetical protein